MESTTLFPKHGGFRKLRSFQTAQIIYDGTVIFCDRFIDKRSRTHDQMVQAARSGVQNIAEGSLASATSKRTELKLTGVARASLGELLLDLEDFLRQRMLRQWKKDDPEAIAVRSKYKEGKAGMPDPSDRSDGSDKPGKKAFHFTGLDAEESANTLICLVNQTSCLLWAQMKTLEKEFLAQGGFTERMYQSRKNSRTQP